MGTIPTDINGPPESPPAAPPNSISVLCLFALNCYENDCIGNTFLNREQLLSTKFLPL